MAKNGGSSNLSLTPGTQIPYTTTVIKYEQKLSEICIYLFKHEIEIKS